MFGMPIPQESSQSHQVLLVKHYADVEIPGDQRRAVGHGSKATNDHEIQVGISESMEETIEVLYHIPCGPAEVRGLPPRPDYAADKREPDSPRVDKQF